MRRFFLFLICAQAYSAYGISQEQWGQLSQGLNQLNQNIKNLIYDYERKKYLLSQLMQDSIDLSEEEEVKSPPTGKKIRTKKIKKIENFNSGNEIYDENQEYQKDQKFLGNKRDIDDNLNKKQHKKQHKKQKIQYQEQSELKP